MNCAAYLFASLDDCETLQQQITDHAAALGLKGTVLLAPEGINLFLAGHAPAVREFLATLRQDPRFACLEAKESWSEQPPFQRLKVKIKKEIIRMDHPAINPIADRADSVLASTLKRWLDQGHDDSGRPVVTLDTRNAFEVDCGSFDNALDWRIDKFTEFPQALQTHKAELEGKTVVSFCTGGIRCEKAALYMREAGVHNVFQLEGGILKYFEEVGQAHYHGECFVFDERRAVDAELQPKKPVA